MNKGIPSKNVQLNASIAVQQILDVLDSIQTQLRMASVTCVMLPPLLKQKHPSAVMTSCIYSQPKGLFQRCPWTLETTLQTLFMEQAQREPSLVWQHLTTLLGWRGRVCMCMEEAKCESRDLVLSVGPIWIIVHQESQPPSGSNLWLIASTLFPLVLQARERIFFLCKVNKKGRVLCFSPGEESHNNNITGCHVKPVAPTQRKLWWNRHSYRLFQWCVLTLPFISI